jgi:hypothetical protein
MIFSLLVLMRSGGGTELPIYSRKTYSRKTYSRKKDMKTMNLVPVFAYIYMSQSPAAYPISDAVSMTFGSPSFKVEKRKTNRTMTMQHKFILHVQILQYKILQYNVAMYLRRLQARPRRL